MEPKPSDVSVLAAQLEAALTSKSSAKSEDDADAMSTHVLRVVQAIGNDEKDALILHLLQQMIQYRTQRTEVAALGERIAKQLVRQQHEMRLSHQNEVDALNLQIKAAKALQTPVIQQLEAQIAQLETKVQEQERHVLFATQKLQRSRTREKQLRRLHDPFWDV